MAHDPNVSQADVSNEIIREGVIAILIILAAIGSLAPPPMASAEEVAAPASVPMDFQRKPLPLITPGTAFTSGPPSGWSHLISFVSVKLTGGDAASVSDTVRYYAEFFNLVMLANVDRRDAGKCELDQVAIGFSMLIDGKNTVVTAGTQDELGGGLSLIGRGVLESNIEALSDVQQVARTSNSMLIDAPAVFLRSGQHREMIVRHFIWVFPENGNVGTLVWLLDPAPHMADGPSRMKIAEPTCELLPPNMHEDRVMNVDADKFSIFGIPAKDAFATVSLPSGVTFEMTEPMRRAAAEKRYTAETFAQLTAAIGHTLKQGTGKQGTETDRVDEVPSQ